MNGAPIRMQSQLVYKGFLNNPNTTTMQEEAIENASLEGITKVFSQDICRAVRKVQVQNNGMIIWKASVTMVFPLRGGFIDCLMSLDICEWGVEYLAMALFNINVRWVEQVLHAVLREGTTLITPNSETTLKGVPDKAINIVFGSEIQNAINESPVRRRELQAGKHITECVSMILIKNGAIINISLGLDAGVQIQNKLYT
jgi:hypothetical protein